MEISLQLLNYIYHFPHWNIPSSQDCRVCEELAGLMATFCQYMVDEEILRQQPCSGYSKEAVADAASFLRQRKSDKISWFPEYGCAVIYYHASHQGSASISIQVVGLDNHKFIAHVGQNDFQFSSIPSAWSPLHVGNIPLDHMVEFEECFREILEKASRRKGGKRSAVDGQGHQRTPAWIHALLCETLVLYSLSSERRQNVIIEPKPIGGFTDVGLHTGGEYRDTHFVLVKSVLHWFLEQTEPELQSKVSFDVFESQFNLYLIETCVVNRLEKFDESSTDEKGKMISFSGDLGALFHVLKSSVHLAAKLSDKGYDYRDYLKRLKIVRSKFDESMKLFDEENKHLFSFELSAFAPKNPKVNISPTSDSQNIEKKDEKRIRILIDQNLGNLQMIGANANIRDVSRYCKRIQVQHDCGRAIFFLKQVESFVWHLSESRLDNPIMISEIEDLVYIVDWYRTLLRSNAFSENEKSLVSLKTRMQSIEVLVVWVVYCLIFKGVKSAKHLEGVMSGFGVALRYDDLRHLVLQDLVHVKVMERVALFLRNHSKEGSDLFSLREGLSPSWNSPSFLMAERYALKHLQSEWQNENTNANERKAGHWREVVRKQDLARRLRSELVGLESALFRAKEEYSEAQSDYDYDGTRWRCDVRDRALSSMVSAQRAVDSKKREIKEAEKAPEPVIQPLPADVSKAMKVLFFLHMPLEFRLLSRLTFTSQQLLLPLTNSFRYSLCPHNKNEYINVSGLVKESDPSVCWHNHYNKFRTCKYFRPSLMHEGKNGEVGLASVSPNTPKQIGPTHVDKFSSDADGVFYPDCFGIRMTWCGGAKPFDCLEGVFFNPFRVKEEFTAVYFTEQLSDDSARGLQWSMNQVQETLIPKSRSNMPYASLDLKPRFLSKEGYIDFANMRSYPRSSLSNLCVALKHNSLPLDNAAVHGLIRQTLFYIGRICCSEKNIQLEYRRDLKNLWSVYQKLLFRLAEIHSEKPQDYRVCQLIGEITNYFAPRVDDPICFYEISTKIANATQQWACDYQKEISKYPHSELHRLYSKQYIFNSVSILCRLNGELNAEEAFSLLSLLLKVCNFYVIDNDDDAPERNALKLQIQYFLGAKVTEYITSLESVPSKLFTSALKGVIQHGVPNDISWQKTDVCFEGTSYDTIYSINTVTGLLLIDGLPPRLLPPSIVESFDYKCIFGSTNLEVVLNGDRLETIRPVDGCFYRFLQNSDRLVIYESVPTTSKEDITDIWSEAFLELLSIENIDSWGGNLPKSFRVYSAWYSRVEKTIVFRKRKYNERETYFIYSPRGCFCIPSHERQAYWLDLLHQVKTFDELVVHDSPFLDILAKFEAKEFIDTFLKGRGHKGAYSVSLYRFGLSFEFDPEISSNLVCKEIKGFHLASNQYHAGVFRGFSRYLVLENLSGKRKLLVPFGKISMNTQVEVELYFIEGEDILPTNGKVEEKLKLFIFDIHPSLDTIVAKDISSRLYLASLHLASSLSVPDSMMMTGEERALELARQSWVNRPYMFDEEFVLRNLKNLSRGKSSIIYLVCEHLEKSSLQCAFLYNSSHYKTENELELAKHVSAYSNSTHETISSRLMLSDFEEQQLGAVTKRPAKCSRPLLEKIDFNATCPVTRGNIDGMYELLGSLIERRRCVQLENFPLKMLNERTNLEKAIMGELKDSWEAHTKNILTYHLKSPSDIRIMIAELEKEVVGKIAATEKHIMGVLRNDIVEGHWHSIAQRMMQLVHIIPSPTKSDLIVIACDSNEVLKFNSVLSDASTVVLKESIVLLLELYVLRDKLNFLRENAPKYDEDIIKSNTVLFENELMSIREWNILEHPYWLVFEVEQEIRIRPEQVLIAKHLMDNPGHIVQLNMGKGKTRVILPMLILHLLYGGKKEVPRLHILKALLSETYSYFHRTLSGSYLNRKLFLLPFQRDLDFQAHHIVSIRDMLRSCQNENGFIIVAPEHRLSIELKIKELHIGNDSRLSEDLKAAIDSVFYHDIFDEVDEVLHHRYQLIYSLGAPTELVQGPHRWNSVQALLKNVILLGGHRAGIRVAPDISKPESFPLLTVCDDVDIDNFRKGVLLPLFESPPHCLSWMKNHPRANEIIEVVINPGVSPRGKLYGMAIDHFNDVLAMRGLLAYDLLLHGISKRHRVDYGVSSLRSKNIVVPYRGADTPSERSEFAHPDSCLVLTCFNYYYSGLNNAQVLEAFSLLLSKGESAKEAIYSEWLNLSKGRMGESHFLSLDSVQKIDLSNYRQVTLITEYFRKNMLTVEFWLNAVVFPNEMDLYARRLVGNSWHLAENTNKKIIGFSGTIDSWRCLPLQVHQFLSQSSDLLWLNIRATNGRMLDVIMKKTVYCMELELSTDRVSKRLIKQVHKLIQHDRSLRALIDSGALLAGASNEFVAKAIMDECVGSNFDGVTFFDDKIQPNGEWMIVEKNGRCLPRNQSPVQEINTFAVFDEPHCRGVDIQLPHDATALLTIGQNMPKDKFMQAAGRMRQLENGKQKLMIIAEKELCNEIKHYGNTEYFSVSATLDWIMKNTVEANIKGLPVWADQGLFFAVGSTPEHSILPEKKDLLSFYGEAVRPVSVSSAVCSSNTFHHKRIGLGQSGGEFVELILGRSLEFGKEYQVSRSGAEEECEREMEREVEEEEEEEIEYVRRNPIEEIDWNYDSVLQAKSLVSLSVPFEALPSVITRHMNAGALKDIDWSSTIFCTENFVNTVDNLQELGTYLRIPGSFVRFPSKEILLVSERESEFIRAKLWDSQLSNYLGNSALEYDEDYQSMKTQIQLPVHQACSLKLYNGETMFSNGQIHQLKKMLLSASTRIGDGDFSVLKASGQPDVIVLMRGKSLSYDRSDLERICCEIATEVSLCS